MGLVKIDGLDFEFVEAVGIEVVRAEVERQVVEVVEVVDIEVEQVAADRLVAAAVEAVDIVAAEAVELADKSAAVIEVADTEVVLLVIGKLVVARAAVELEVRTDTELQLVPELYEERKVCPIGN